jgi:hypothetical protein
MAGLAAVSSGAGALAGGADNSPVNTSAKRLLIVFQVGGVSQFESWDPKPGTATGGPFQAIPTSVPGLHVSELLPHTAAQMHHLAIVRSMSTRDNDHDTGRFSVMAGRRKAGLRYPDMGCVAHKYLTPAGHSVPGHVALERYDKPNEWSATFLGPKYEPVRLFGGELPANIALPDSRTADFERRRQTLRQQLNAEFDKKRGNADSAAYAQSFESARSLMRNRKLFDVNREPDRDHERYGRHPMGQRCLLARRLLEKGVTCVRVCHGSYQQHYDTHSDHFNVHPDLLEQFDRPFACLLHDMAESGLLEETLIVCLGDFGRTPTINANMGRDHYSAHWSLALAGTGLKRGIAVGMTDKQGVEVKVGRVNVAQIFHTVMTALGIDPTHNHEVAGDPIPIGNPDSTAIPELLA